MDNQTRRILLERVKASGFPGSILDVFQNPAVLDQFIAEQQQSQLQQPQNQQVVAQTPQEQEQGLRPYHNNNITNVDMSFPNVQANQVINTVGMKIPIDIKEVDNQGNLVKSFEAVPPGIANFPTGANEGSTLIESPAKGYQKGGFHQRIYTDPIEFAKANEAYNDSLAVYNAPQVAYNKSKEIDAAINGGNFQKAQELLDKPYPFTKAFSRLTRLNNGLPKPTSGYAIYLGADPSNRLTPKYKKPTEEPVYREKLNLQATPYKGLSINSNPPSLGDMTSMFKSSPLNYKYQLQPGVYGNQIRVGVYQDGKYQPFSRERIQNEIEENRIPDQREENYLRIQKLKGHQTGGVRKYQTAGPVYSEVAADATAVKVNPLVRAINIDEPLPNIDKPLSNFDYQNYYDKANKYLSRDIFKGTTLTAKDIADAANEFYIESNYQYPLDLLLTQAQIESKLGKALKSKHNYFNVGNTDSGATRDFASAKDSVRDYINLMYNDYLNKGQKSVDELLKPKGFVNHQGNRYASNPDYENMLSSQMQFINNYLKNHKTGGVKRYQTAGFDVERIMADMQYPGYTAPTVDIVGYKSDKQKEKEFKDWEKSVRSKPLPSGAITPTLSPIDAAVGIAAGIPGLMYKGLQAGIPALASTLNTPAVVGSTTLPGVTMGNILGAAGAGYSTQQILDPSSELRTNPNAENVLMTGLGFVGTGIGKGLMSGAKSLLKRSPKEVTPDFSRFQNQLPVSSEYVSGSYTPDYIDLRRPTQYNRDLLSADYANLINGYPEGSSFMNYPNLTREEVEQTWRNLNNRIQPAVKPKSSINKSGLTKDEVLTKVSAKDKDAISKMSETEFENTVLKPTGEIVPYESQVDLMPHFTGSNNVFAMSLKEYVERFNENIDLLNDIIAQKNKSGVEYRVKGLDENGRLTFYTPPGQKGKNPLIKKGLEDVNIPEGESSWATNINAGQWRGNVEDIASTEYFRSIPGLEMRNSSSGVFADNVARRGTGAYEAINEYLKRLDLGRVKPGFNSQTDFSRGAWENFIKSGRGVGFYANPRTVYGTMKSVFPYIGAGYLGYKGLQGAAASQKQQQKTGGVRTYLKGGLKNRVLYNKAKYKR